jgi:Zn-dependent protease
MGTGYFRYEPRRLSYAELARIVRGQGSPLLMWIMKSLGISWHSAWARKYPASIQEWVIRAEDLPAPVAEALAVARAEMTANGFQSIAFLGQAGCLYPSEAGTEIYWHTRGLAIATVTFSRSATMARTVVSISTGTQEGKILSTTNRADFNLPPRHVGKEIWKGSATVVWKAHQARLPADGRGMWLILRPGEAVNIQEEYERETWDWLIKRRVMVECTPEEVARAQRRLEMALGAGGEGHGPNASVMLEMAHILERKQTRQEKMWAFGVTLGLFLLVGFVWWEPKMLWMLAVALIIHELGHYVTMRLFGYRNLRMIFVPLGGAAVIGQNFNVPGWKKAIVSLMGPLPGILFAAGCAVWAVARGPNTIRDEAAILVLVLNGLNLLPVFPLDGGAYLNAILFCRNAKLEAVFKALAIGVLAIAAITFRDFLLGGLAYFLLLGLMRSFRLARLTEQLRTEVAIPPANDPNALPMEIRNRVIDGVKTALRKPASAKTVAAHALGIFERLNARPPGALGTISLMAVYAVTFLIAILALGAILAAKRDQDLAKRHSPRILWNCGGSAKVVIRPQSAQLAAVTFKTPDNRDAFLEMAEKEFRTNQPIVVGRTVFMPYANEDFKKLVRETRKQFGRMAFERQTAGYRTRPVCYWTIRPESEEAAAEIENEINLYFEVSLIFNAYAPWAPDRKPSDEEKRARNSLVALSKIQDEVDANPTNDSLKTSERINKSIAAIQRTAATNAVLDIPTVTWFTNYLMTENDLKFLETTGSTGADRLGRAPKEETTGAKYVNVERTGRELRVEMQFLRMEQGFAAFGNWLCDRNWPEIFYAFK